MGWYMALTAISAYAPPGTGALAAVAVAAVFAAPTLPWILARARSGTQVRRMLTDPRRLQLFNLVMAVLLILTMLPILRGMIQARE